MSFEINIADAFEDVAKIFTDVAVKYSGQSARYAINRTLLTLRKESILMIKEELHLTSKTIRDKYITLQKARGSRLGEVYGQISFSGAPIPLIEFMSGNKSPADQKGVPIKSRRKVRVEITPGKRFVVPHAFVQTVHSTQIFKRGHGAGLKKQGVRSIAYAITHKGIGDRLATLGQARFKELFIADLRARIAGAIPHAQSPT